MKPGGIPFALGLFLLVWAATSVEYRYVPPSFPRQPDVNEVRDLVGFSVGGRTATGNRAFRERAVSIDGAEVE